MLARRFWWSVFALSHRMREEAWSHSSLTADDLADVGDITLAQRRVCAAIHRLGENRPEGPGLKEVARSLGLTSGTVSALVENLVRRGWLLREASSVDRRAVLLRPSERSRELMRRRAVFFSEFTRCFFEDFASEERMAFVRLATGFLKMLSMNQKECPE